MSKIFSKMSLGLLAAVAVAWPAGAAAPLQKTLSGHVPAVVSRLTPTGRLAATNQMALAIGLPLRNQEGLDALMAQINDPASPLYRHYLSPDEFTAQFGPTRQDYQTVLDFAKANGLTVTRTHGNRMVVDVVAQTTNIEQAFHVKLRTYHHPTEHRDFFAPDSEPTVDAQVPMLSIQGLNNYALPKRMLQHRPAGAKPGNGSGPGNSYIGSDFRNAYAPGVALRGAGQVVGLLQFDGYIPTDITTYEGLAGLTNMPLQNVLLDGFNGVPNLTDPNNGNDEVCLDIEMSMSMAPGLAQIVVFEAGPAGFPNDILSSMAASNTIKQLSSSWGYTADATTEQLYKELALQGQTYLNCSGDGDAWVGPIPYGACESPNITIVGGTTLTMSGTGAAYASEQAWNWGFSADYNWNPDGFAGTSGGISTDRAIPRFQQGINMVTNQGSTTFRNVPDIALTADNVFVVSSGGQENILGGTSAATPLWAGFMALVNQQAAQSGQPSIGFLAPKVYALAATASYTNYFHDVMAGNNYWDQSLTNFPAVPGYDLCTGLGTPNGQNLINGLAGINTNTLVNLTTNTVTISAPQISPNWITNLTVMNGSNPNGDWFLFIQDDQPFDAGMLNNGWYVTLTTGNPVGYPADNALLASVTNVVVAPGTNFYVTLSVTNWGPAASTNVLVTDVLPATGVSLIGTNFTQGAVYRLGSTLIWSNNNLAVNTGASITLKFSASADGIYLNDPTVSAGAATPDPNPDDDTADTAIIVGVLSPPVLSAIAVAGPGNHFQFYVTDAVGMTSVNTSVIVQASTNLVTWLPIYTNNTPFTFTDVNATNYPDRFYRVITGP
jgi:uncharacterized repeat protein (TIGR01451 family)